MHLACRQNPVYDYWMLDTIVSKVHTLFNFDTISYHLYTIWVYWRDFVSKVFIMCIYFDTILCKSYTSCVILKQACVTKTSHVTLSWFLSNITHFMWLWLHIILCNNDKINYTTVCNFKTVKTLPTISWNYFLFQMYQGSLIENVLFCSRGCFKSCPYKCIA